MRITKLLASFLLISAFASSSQATLLDGKTIGYNYYHNTLLWQSGSAVVGPQLEVPSIISLISLNASDTQLQLDLLHTTQFQTIDTSGFNGLEVFDALDAISAFTAISVETNISNFDTDRISFDANHVWINLVGFASTAGDFITINLRSTSSEVPEPASLTLAGLALVGLAMARRSKRN
jgi:hypothetical protein